MKSSLVILLHLSTIVLAQSAQPTIIPSGFPCTTANERKTCNHDEVCDNGRCNTQTGPQPGCSPVSEIHLCLSDERCVRNKCEIYNRDSCSPEGTKPIPSSYVKDGPICCDGLLVDPTTKLCYRSCARNSDCVYTKFHRKILGKCVNKKCERPKPCGNCGNEPEEGRCCDGHRPDRITGICSCDCTTDHDCNGNMVCEKNQCVTLILGITCGTCGEAPVDGRCCRPQKLPANGKPCYCDPGRGQKCESHDDCGFNGLCTAGSCGDI